MRNTPDGTVEAVFEGEPDAVEALVGFVARGPARARVERVEVAEEEPEGLTDFRVTDAARRQRRRDLPCDRDAARHA